MTAAADGDPTVADQHQNQNLMNKLIPFSPEPQAVTIFDDIGTYPLVYRDKYERMPKMREPEPRCVRRDAVTEEMRLFVEQLHRQRSPR